MRRVLLVLMLLAAPATGLAQDTSGQSQTRRMSVSWVDVPIQQVLRAFAAYSGMSIVAGANVTGSVTADINDQPWDVALQTILSVHGLVGIENEYGIIRVENLADVSAREVIEPLVTRSYRISYSRAGEIQTALQPILTERGSMSVVEGSNTLVVTDIARVHRTIQGLLR